MFCFVNNLIPTGEKLSAYNVRRNASLCGKCGAVDDVSHRLKMCPNAKRVWQWCSEIIRTRMKTDVSDLENFLSQRVCLRSQKQKAALWLTVRVISFNLAGPEPSLFVFKRQLRELRWNNRKVFDKHFGRYLNIC